MVWPTLGTRMAKEQNGTEANFEVEHEWTNDWLKSLITWNLWQTTVSAEWSNNRWCNSTGCQLVQSIKYQLHALGNDQVLLDSRALETGKLPGDWKLAEVTAIYKKGSKHDRSNYRPVSVTSVCCKILESLLGDHMMNYLLANNLLSTKQYGFIKNRSTSLQLLQITDKWTEYLEYGGQVDVMYSDFEKAFDKVPHKRLISKLISYGFNSTFLWPPCIAGCGHIYFHPVVSFFFLFLFPRLISAVGHWTSTILPHMVWP